MRNALTILVAGLLACGFSTYASAQDGIKFGMGIELQNQPTTVMLGSSGTLTQSTGATFLTPSVLFTIQVTPSMFIEPSIGYHRTGYKEEYTGPPAYTEELTGSDLQFGVGLIYALKPAAAVSPMLHPMLGIHKVKATGEMTGAETGKIEVSTTAFQVGLGVGGLINVKETVYLTVEARFMFTKVGDFAETSTDPEFKDDTDTSASNFDTDMVIGLRFVF